MAARPARDDGEQLRLRFAEHRQTHPPRKNPESGRTCAGLPETHVKLPIEIEAGGARVCQIIREHIQPLHACAQTTCCDDCGLIDGLRRCGGKLPAKNIFRRTLYNSCDFAKYRSEMVCLNVEFLPKTVGEPTISKAKTLKNQARRLVRWLHFSWLP
jgi:hypothetical protein